MKYVIYVLALLPFFLSAQEDHKYLEGAVPEENGKVVFSKVIHIPSTNRQEMYALALSWVNERFVDDKEKESEGRVVFQNSENGEIAAVGKEYIVFSSSFFSLDRSKLSYQVRIHCEDDSCLIKLTNIRYEYNVSYQDMPEKYIAEEWITDKYAIYKGKLSRITGKFRKSTIDFAEALFDSAEQAFEQMYAQVETSVHKVQEEVPSVKFVRTQKDPEGFTRINVDNIPTTMQNFLPNSSLVVKVDDNILLGKGVVWKGFGKLFGKQIASVSIPKESEFCKGVKDGEVYTLQFASDDEEIRMIVECSKQGETEDGENHTIIGEVLNIWVK